MSKNTIIAIVIGGIAILLFIFILVLPTSDVDESSTDRESEVQEEIVEREVPPIAQLTEEEMVRIQAILEEAVPSDTPREDLEELDAALLRLSLEELRALTVEIVQNMLAEIQA